MRRLSLVVASGGHSSSCRVGLSLSRPLLLQGTGSRLTGSVVVAHGLSRSAACGILPDQGLNPCPLLWQADSQPLRHQGSPSLGKFKKIEIISSIFSDHNAMRLDINYREKTVKNTNTWRLNSMLLNTQGITEELKEEIKKYLEKKSLELLKK